MKVALWNDHRNYVEITHLEYGKLSKEQIDANKAKWDEANEIAVAISNDGIMSSYEKKQAKKEWDMLELEFKSVLNQAQSYWPSKLPVEIVNLQTARDALYKYLFITLDSKGKPLLSENNINTDSLIDKSEYDTTFLAFYDALKKGTKKISEEGKRLADEAIDMIDGIKDNIVYSVQVISSNGNIFRNGRIDSTLSAKVFHGKDDITDKVPATEFNWHRVSADPDNDVTWNQTKGKAKKEIAITADDVRYRATFFCDVNLDNLGTL